MILSVAQKQCLTCTKVVRGRSDKKFCDDNCRNVFNNQQKSSVEKNVVRINQILRKNRQVLSSFFNNDQPRLKVHKERLLIGGFNFLYTTHSCTGIKSGATYHFCYDYGFRLLKNDMVLLIRKNWGFD
ncbi:MAG: hypothetical protein ACOYKE_00905 [Ferruginibacter sp.]